MVALFTFWQVMRHFSISIIFGIVILCFYISLRHHGNIQHYIKNSKYQDIMHGGNKYLTPPYHPYYKPHKNSLQKKSDVPQVPEQGKMRSPPRIKKKYCLPNAYFKKQQGLPGPCDDSMLVLDCPNPFLEYLYDPDALNTCGVTNDSRLPKRRKQVIKGPGIANCRKEYRILISNPSLPISPKPQPTHGKVPKIVHYVSLGCNRTFTFANYLSVLSVHRFIRPGRIYFHGDCTPKGPWWQKTTDTIPNMYFQQWSRIKLIQGKHPRWVEHETDIIRLQVLLGKKHHSLVGRFVVSF